MENIDGKLVFSTNSYRSVPKLIELKTHSSTWEFEGVILECSEFSFKSMRLTLIIDKIYGKSDECTCSKEIEQTAEPVLESAAMTDFDTMFSTPLTEEETKAWKEMDQYNPAGLANILNLQEYSSVRKIIHKDLYELNGFKQVFEWLKTIDAADKAVLYYMGKDNDHEFLKKLNEHPHLDSVTRFQFELIKRYLYGCSFETIE